ncbi:glycoside hydrolase family 26 protein [Spirosoma aerophilum]
MNYKKIIYFLAGVILTVSLYKIVSNRFNKTTQSTYKFDEPVIGVYDRTHVLPTTSTAAAFQHISLTLTKSFEEAELAKLTIPTNKPLLVTILMPEGTFFGGSNLKQIASGDYDDSFKTLCEGLVKKDANLFLRMDPEMEVPVQWVAWQNQSPYDYIRAFQHFSLVCKAVDPRIRIVWGPAGYPGADEFWPGSKPVDAISVTLDSRSEQLTTAYPHAPDAVTELKRKIHRMRFMNKPILMLGPANFKANAQNDTLPKRAIHEIDQNQQFIYATVHPDLSDQKGAVRSTTKPVLGVYDPGKLLLTAPPITVEHIFVSLDNIEDGLFARAFQEITARHHNAIVTVEPWKDKKRIRPNQVLQNTVDGAYDTQFTELYRIISNTRQTVYLRFAHEMEIPIHRYPWQSQDPVLYTKAYRYFMNFDKNHPKNIKRVWGPAGDRGALEWWPGNDVVDYISVAIYGLPDKNITDPKKQESFSTIFNRKYYRMRFADKPVFVTEFGVKGPEDYQRQWLDDAATFIREQKEIVGVCYFNLADNPDVWGKMPAPDWSINKKTFLNFVNELTK